MAISAVTEMKLPTISSEALICEKARSGNVYQQERHTHDVKKKKKSFLSAIKTFKTHLFDVRLCDLLCCAVSSTNVITDFPNERHAVGTAHDVRTFSRRRSRLQYTPHGSGSGSGSIVIRAMFANVSGEKKEKKKIHHAQQH